MIKIKIPTKNITNHKYINQIYYFTVTKKGIQQHLIKSYGIRVHKNDLINEPNRETIGNTTANKLNDILSNMKLNDIPYESQFQHDMTRWKSSKDKCKQRLKDRNFKLNN